VKAGRLIALVTVAAVFPFGAAAANGSWSALFDDTPNDAASGPEIYRLLLGSSDDGFVSFEVDAKLKAAKSVTLFIDADGSGKTGDPANDGAELRFDLTDAGRKRRLSGWRASRWTTILPPTASAQTTPYGAELFISRRDLGGSKDVNVWAESTGRGTDRIPDRGEIHYDLRPLRLTVAHFKDTSGHLSERLELTIRRSDSGGFLVGELPLCSAHIGGKAVFARLLDQARQTSPAAYCLWRFPTSLRGKEGRATITIQLAGRTVARGASFVVK
jgi:hypothetical protein